METTVKSDSRSTSARPRAHTVIGASDVTSGGSSGGGDAQDQAGDPAEDTRGNTLEVPMRQRRSGEKRSRSRSAVRPKAARQIDEDEESRATRALLMLDGPDYELDEGDNDEGIAKDDEYDDEMAYSYEDDEDDEDFDEDLDDDLDDEDEYGDGDDSEDDSDEERNSSQSSNAEVRPTHRHYHHRQHPLRNNIFNGRQISIVVEGDDSITPMETVDADDDSDSSVEMLSAQDQIPPDDVQITAMTNDIDNSHTTADEITDNYDGIDSESQRLENVENDAATFETDGARQISVAIGEDSASVTDTQSMSSAASSALKRISFNGKSPVRSNRSPSFTPTSSTTSPTPRLRQQRSGFFGLKSRSSTGTSGSVSEAMVPASPQSAKGNSSSGSRTVMNIFKFGKKTMDQPPLSSSSSINKSSISTNISNTAAASHSTGATRSHSPARQLSERLKQHQIRNASKSSVGTGGSGSATVFPRRRRSFGDALDDLNTIGSPADDTDTLSLTSTAQHTRKRRSNPTPSSSTQPAASSIPTHLNRDRNPLGMIKVRARNKAYIELSRLRLVQRLSDGAAIKQSPSHQSAPHATTLPTPSASVVGKTESTNDAAQSQFHLQQYHIQTSPAAPVTPSHHVSKSPFHATTEVSSNPVGGIAAVRFNTTGEFLAAGGRDSVLRVWRLSDSGGHKDIPSKSQSAAAPKQGPPFRGIPYRILSGHTGSITDLCFSRHDYILTASTDTTARLWHVNVPHSLRVFSHTDPNFFATHNVKVPTATTAVPFAIAQAPIIAFHPVDDRLLLTAYHRRLRLWALTSTSASGTAGVRAWTDVPRSTSAGADHHLDFDHTTGTMVTALAFTRDGATVIVGTGDGDIFFYETEGLRYSTRVEIARATLLKNPRSMGSGGGDEHDGPGGIGAGEKVTPGGGLFSAGPRITGLDIWRGGNQTSRSGGEGGSDDGLLLVTATDSKLRLYNLRDRSLVRRFRGPEIRGGKIGVGVAEKGAADAESSGVPSGGGELHQHSYNAGGGGFIRASFSDDGRYIICGSEDRRVFFFNTEPAPLIIGQRDVQMNLPVVAAPSADIGESSAAAWRRQGKVSKRAAAMLAEKAAGGAANDLDITAGATSAPGFTGVFSGLMHWQADASRSAQFERFLASADTVTCAIFAPHSMRKSLESCGLRDHVNGSFPNGAEGIFIVTADVFGVINIYENVIYKRSSDNVVASVTPMSDMKSLAPSSNPAAYDSDSSSRLQVSVGADSPLGRKLRPRNAPSGTVPGSGRNFSAPSSIRPSLPSPLAVDNGTAQPSTSADSFGESDYYIDSHTNANHSINEFQIRKDLWRGGVYDDSAEAFFLCQTCRPDAALSRHSYKKRMDTSDGKEKTQSPTVSPIIPARSSSITAEPQEEPEVPDVPSPAPQNPVKHALGFPSHARDSRFPLLSDHLSKRSRSASANAADEHSGTNRHSPSHILPSSGLSPSQAHVTTQGPQRRQAMIPETLGIPGDVAAAALTGAAPPLSPAISSPLTTSSPQPLPIPTTTNPPRKGAAISRSEASGLLSAIKTRIRGTTLAGLSRREVIPSSPGQSSHANNLPSSQSQTHQQQQPPLAAIELQEGETTIDVENVSSQARDTQIIPSIQIEGPTKASSASVSDVIFNDANDDAADSLTLGSAISCALCFNTGFSLHSNGRARCLRCGKVRRILVK